MKKEDVKDYEDCFKHYQKEGLLGELHFSGRTYQLQSFDQKSRKEVWCFFQFSEDGDIKDAFCSCEEELCEHLGICYWRILNGNEDPLHLRFEESLWNCLCRIYAYRQGYETKVLKKERKGQYLCYASSAKPLFLIRAKEGPLCDFVETLIEKRKPETEENSLKFSDLSEEEILLWKEGRPKPRLRYELSFWSDIAKYLMLRQESGDPYKIYFRFQQSGSPKEIWIDFQDLVVAFYLSEANLPKVIPTLALVQSPLPVYNFNEEAVQGIFYHKESYTLHLELREGYLHSKALPKERENMQQFGDWLFDPKSGFYFCGKHSLLDLKEVNKEQINEVFKEHAELISRHLMQEHLFKEPQELSYQIFFDADWKLHVRLYFREFGDLQKGYSYFFGDWAYLEDEGFYFFEDTEFQDVETVIEAKDVSRFVHQRRSFLNSQEGFQTHLSSVEERLAYCLDEALEFFSSVDISIDQREAKDFGDWIYVVGQGFYSKIRGQLGLPVHAGLKVPLEEVSHFIKTYRQDLEHIKGFFSLQCPIIRAGLEIFLEGDTILIQPKYDLQESLSLEEIQLFDDFVYIKGQGFCEIPLQQNLPKDYRQPLRIEGDRMALFLSYELDSLERHAFFIDQRLRKIRQASFYLKRLVAGELFERKGLLSFSIIFQSEHGQICLSKIWEALRLKKRYLFSEAGLIDLQDEKFDYLRQMQLIKRPDAERLFSMSVLEFMRLNALEEIIDPKEDEIDSKESLALLHRLRNLQSDLPLNLKGLKSSLRPYQKNGVDWLWFLYQHHLSGLLCDDMGLGKTHQAMALFAAVKNVSKKAYFLVVCPTSVIHHWKEKLQDFFPSLRVCVFHGPNRSLDGFLRDYDVLLTSFGVLRREKEMLGLIHFDVAVFDEVQLAKNHLSKLYHSLANVQAKMRLGLSGTPLENYLRELKALFDLVLPQYMPSDEKYRQVFIQGIEKETGKIRQERKEQLSRFIRPFILRRKKEQVLHDLPEKTEEIAHCELSLEQMQKYQELLKNNQVLSSLRKGQEPIQYMHVFSLLLQLKKLCNHPALYLQETQSYQEHQSGKWELFVELLLQARHSQQKLVVFSQYLGMLDIIEAYLKEEGIAYASIRGSTRNRAQEIERFQKDPKCEVFVASLFAAGLGIDLTAASVVIHYDRWWNAAKENQATDRVHRIGQTRGVQVFKLVTLGTLEEKIDAMIEKKGSLMEDLIGQDDHAAIKRIDRRDLIELFEFAAE